MNLIQSGKFMGVYHGNTIFSLNSCLSNTSAFYIDYIEGGMTMALKGKAKILGQTPLLEVQNFSLTFRQFDKGLREKM